MVHYHDSYYNSHVVIALAQMGSITNRVKINLEKIVNIITINIININLIISQSRAYAAPPPKCYMQYAREGKLSFSKVPT